MVAGAPDASMARPIHLGRCLVEVLAIILAAKTAAALVTHLADPIVPSLAGGLLDAAVLTGVALPLLSWRIRARLASANRWAERLAEIARRTSNAVIITDVHRRIVWVNDAFTQITGFTLDEVRGRVPGHVLQCERSEPEAIQAMRQALTRGEACRVVITNRAKSGRVYNLDIEIQPLRDPSGTLTGFMAIESDITEKVRAAEQIARQEAMLRETGEVAGIGGWELDVATMTPHWSIQTRRLHEVADDFQPTLDNAIGFYAPEARDTLRRAVQRAIEAGESYDIEDPFITARGRSL